jgi:hypothetical protein
MSLKKGLKNANKNFAELMGGVESSSRHKAILTIAKRKRISYNQAKEYQANKIVQSLAFKKK